MNYLMAFVIGVFINLGYFKLRIGQQIRNAERHGYREITVNYKWKVIMFDAFWWGLTFLIIYFIWKVI